jgi:hypothetical protein
MNGISMFFIGLGIALFAIAAIVLEMAVRKSLKYLWLGYTSPYDLKARFGIQYTIMDRRVPLVFRRRFVISLFVSCLSSISIAIGLLIANRRELSVVAIAVSIIFIYSSSTVYIDYNRVNKSENRDAE